MYHAELIDWYTQIFLEGRSDKQRNDKLTPKELGVIVDKLAGIHVDKMRSGNTRVRVRCITNNSKWITIPNGLSRENFIVAYHNARNGLKADFTPAVDKPLAERAGFQRSVGDMLVGARKRARERGFDCTITRDDLIRIINEQDGKCAVSGVPFSLPKLESGKKRPTRMSVDRIDRRGGYTPDNIRITTAIANVAMMDWDFRDFVLMCHAVAAKHRKPR